MRVRTEDPHGTWPLAGTLPWLVYRNEKQSDEFKQKVSVEDLCRGLPSEIAAFMNMCRNMPHRCLQHAPCVGHVACSMQHAPHMHEHVSRDAHSHGTGTTRYTRVGSMVRLRGSTEAVPRGRRPGNLTRGLEMTRAAWHVADRR